MSLQTGFNIWVPAFNDNLTKQWVALLETGILIIITLGIDPNLWVTHFHLNLQRFLQGFLQNYNVWSYNINVV